MKLFLLIISALLILNSCKNNDKPKLVHTEDDIIETTASQKDSTLVEIVDLPIHIDSTKYLIHPIGTYKIYESRSKAMPGYSTKNSRNFSISSYNRYEITGNLSNLKFQHINTDDLTELTNKNLRIKSISFLRDIFENTTKQFLVYRVIDKDTNLDNKIDDFDITSLYISNIDGSGFVKLTLDNRELIDWKVLAVKNRLYFRSIEDIDKNGEFDQSDKVHYQFVDFESDSLRVVDYYPI